MNVNLFRVYNSASKTESLDEGGRTTGYSPCDCRRHEQRRTNAVQDQTIEFDTRLSNTLKTTCGKTLDEIEHLLLFKSLVHAL